MGNMKQMDRTDMTSAMVLGIFSDKTSILTNFSTNIDHLALVYAKVFIKLTAYYTILREGFTH